MNHFQTMQNVPVNKYHLSQLKLYKVIVSANVRCLSCIGILWLDIVANLKAITCNFGTF